MPGLREQLEQCLTGRVCLMGLGNVDYGDDGFGVRLAADLAASGLPEGWQAVVAGTTPERVIGRPVANGCEHLVFLDAVEFGGAPGSAVFLDSKEVAARFPQVSTHKISLALLGLWAESNGTTRAWLLGVQPESLNAGQPLTTTMQETLEALRELLRGVASSQQQVEPPAPMPMAEASVR
jgi:hydrogenase 3 maturation protease